MGYSRVLYFLVFCVIILTVLVLYLFFPLLALSTPPKESRPIQSLTVIDHSGEININSGTYIVTGTAKNTGTTTIVKIYVVVTTFDSNGSVLGSTYDTLLDLGPGESTSFRIETWPYYQGYRVSQYSIEPDYNFIPELPGKGNYSKPASDAGLAPRI